MRNGVAARPSQEELFATVSVLSTRSPNESEHLLARFRRGLAETGYAEGRNVIISTVGYCEDDRAREGAREPARGRARNIRWRSRGTVGKGGRDHDTDRVDLRD